MTDENRNFDDEPKLGIPAGLNEDLRGLFNSGLSVPPEVDRAIIDGAHRHLIRRGRRRLWPRWAAVAGAAVAVVLFAVVMKTQFSAVSQTKHKADAVYSKAAAVAGDIDLNGRVDILDAFKLARHVESAGAVEAKWDFNGDGLVNRDDVDFVAFAAVRLNKGV